MNPRFLRGRQPRLASLLGAVAATLLITGCGDAAPTSGAASNAADRFSAQDRAAIEAIVREYILSHPEIIPEAINGMQAREVTKLIDARRADIETPFKGAFAGNPNGDVVLVEFFDYACPYCRASHADVQKLIAEDKQLKVVYRDFPVLSPASEEAAQASLAAAEQDRYLAFHDRMFETPGKVTREKVVATVRAAGMNEKATAAEMASPAVKAEITKNLDLGRALGLTGTPSYVVGNQLLGGAVGYDALKKAIAAARTKKAG